LRRPPRRTPGEGRVAAAESRLAWSPARRALPPCTRRASHTARGPSAPDPGARGRAPRRTCTLAVQAATASWASPAKVFAGRQRYSFDSSSSVPRTGLYQRSKGSGPCGDLGMGRGQGGLCWVGARTRARPGEPGGGVKPTQCLVQASKSGGCRCPRKTGPQTARIRAYVVFCCRALSRHLLYFRAAAAAAAAAARRRCRCLFPCQLLEPVNTGWGCTWVGRKDDRCQPWRVP
jgi:hypothetical protein